MTDWQVHPVSQHGGLLVIQKEHSSRRAIVSVSPSDSGGHVVSLSIDLAADRETAKAFAERWLKDMADQAVRLDGSR